jgi:hypothetical protein
MKGELLLLATWMMEGVGMGLIGRVGSWYFASSSYTLVSNGASFL